MQVFSGPDVRDGRVRVAHELQVQIWRNVRRAFEIRQAENGLTQSGIAARMGLHRARVNYWMTRPERMTLAAAGHPVVLWARDPQHVAAMQSTRRNDRQVAGVDFPASLNATADIADLSACPVVLLAVPSAVV